MYRCIVRRNSQPAVIQFLLLEKKSWLFFPSHSIVSIREERKWQGETFILSENVLTSLTFRSCFFRCRMDFPQSAWVLKSTDDVDANQKQPDGCAACERDTVQRVTIASSARPLWLYIGQNSCLSKKKFYVACFVTTLCLPLQGSTIHAKISVDTTTQQFFCNYHQEPESGTTN